MQKSTTNRELYSQGLREIGLSFSPGLGVKRWFLFVLAGITLLGVGLALALLELYRTESTNPILLEILSAASLRFLPRVLRVLIFGGLGIGLVSYGIYQLNRSLLRPFIQPGHTIVDELTNYSRREGVPRLVAIGG